MDEETKRSKDADCGWCFTCQKCITQQCGEGSPEELSEDKKAKKGKQSRQPKYLTEPQVREIVMDTLISLNLVPEQEQRKVLDPATG